MTDPRQLPSVDSLLRADAAQRLILVYGRTLTLAALRVALARQRELVLAGSADNREASQSILEASALELQTEISRIQRPVINATGIILHTNLGRAPVSRATAAAMQIAASGYSNLELDLQTGKRGQRDAGIEWQLRQLVGSESATAVNNAAGALLLALAALASRKRVVVARSQLVEIGGGYRLPEVMKQSGARLVEVGTTNKVRISDYAQALEGAGLVLVVHRSNFAMVGFTAEPQLAEIVSVAHNAAIPVVHDLGSGALLDTAVYGIAHEPTVQESIAAGADVVCFSGDKLLGGPQAGILVGISAHVARIRKHPLARALRLDKAGLAGVSTTLMHYLRDEAEQQVPIWRMISRPQASLHARAASWAGQLGFGEARSDFSELGGGSLPGQRMETHVLAIPGPHASQLAKRLREQEVPVIARIYEDAVLLDPRTVDPTDDGVVMDAVARARMELA